MEPSRNPNSTSLHAGQAPLLALHVQHTQYTALPKSRSCQTETKASSPWSKDQVADGLRVSRKKKEKPDNIRGSQKLQRQREADHEAGGYLLFYAQSEDLSTHLTRLRIPPIGSLLMHSRVCCDPTPFETGSKPGINVNQ
jgi:hypothetical protein